MTGLNFALLGCDMKLGCPTILVTGASSGFGREIAREALSRNYRVAATARNPESLDDLVKEGGEYIVALRLDVSDESTIDQAMKDVGQRFGQIDVLVNNAGIGLVGSVEECSQQEIERLFDINFHGCIRMIKAVLPQMRRRGSGTIVNMSSRAGVAAVGGCGIYAATKFALEGLSEALRLELDPLGIAVLLVEPGAFRTDYAARSLIAAEREIGDYAATSGMMRQRIPASDGLQPGDPALAAKAILDAVDNPDRPFRLVLGAEAASMLAEVMQTRLKEIRSWAGVSRSVDRRPD